MTGVHVPVSAGVLRRAHHHDEEVKAYERWQDGAGADQRHARGLHLLRDHLRGVPGPGDRCQATVRRFIAAWTRAHAFPLGTMDTFATYFAPPDFNETANTVGLPLYAKQEPRKFDRGTDLHAGQPAADVPPPRRAGQADDGVMGIVEQIYEVGRQRGLLKDCLWRPADGSPPVAAVGFAAPDDTVLDG